jgi:hypothetical protein
MYRVDSYMLLATKIIHTFEHVGRYDLDSRTYFLPESARIKF